MRFPADMGVSISRVVALRQVGHDVEHLIELGLIRLEGRLIVHRARQQGRIVITFDLDFGEIVALSQELYPSVILFRTRRQTPAAVTPRLLQVVRECESDLVKGVFVMIKDLGYRLRHLPIGSPPHLSGWGMYWDSGERN